MQKLKRLISVIKSKLRSFKNWNKKYTTLDYNIAASTILKLFIALIPIYGILYLTTFYAQFKVDYFIYFHPLDFVRVFYDNNGIFLRILTLSGFIIPFCIVIFRKTHRQLPINLIFCYVCSMEFIIGVLLIRYVDSSLVWEIIFWTLGALVLNLLVLVYKYFDILLYGYICLFLLAATIIAKDKAISVEKYKYSFDIILNDNTYLLEETPNDCCKYFIGNLTNYVFIYDCSIEKMRAIPMKNIKEIRFNKQ